MLKCAKQALGHACAGQSKVRCAKQVWSSYPLVCKSTYKHRLQTCSANEISLAEAKESTHL